MYSYFDYYVQKIIIYSLINCKSWVRRIIIYSSINCKAWTLHDVSRIYIANKCKYWKYLSECQFCPSRALCPSLPHTERPQCTFLSFCHTATSSLSRPWKSPPARPRRFPPARQGRSPLTWLDRWWRTTGISSSPWRLAPQLCVVLKSREDRTWFTLWCLSSLLA